MPVAAQRIVVQTTLHDKKAFVAKAKKLALPLSELMRRGAVAYASDESHADLDTLADAARSATERAAAALDAAGDFIDASNRRIAAMEAAAARRKKAAGATEAADAPAAPAATKAAARKAA